MNKIVLATNNSGKVKELAAMLAPLNIEILPQKHFNVPDADETGVTFIENAIIKARHAAQLTGLPAIADDSGLSVDCLNGAPGVYSARFAGPHATDQQNIDKLLAEMQDIASPKRNACFHCVLVYLRHALDPTPIICHGQWHGEISQVQKGTGGFGYDSVFYIASEQANSAQLTPSRKNQLSHRGQALSALINSLQSAVPQR